MRIRLREQKNNSLRTLLDLETSNTGEMIDMLPEGVMVQETSRIVLQIYPDELDNFSARIWIGKVLIASTDIDTDHPQFPIELPLNLEEQPDHLLCVGTFFQDWAGEADCRIESATPAGWHDVITFRANVCAGKMMQDALEELYSDIAKESAALLLDVYGKTYLGIQPTTFPGETAPIIALNRVSTVLDELHTTLRCIARQPAYRLKTDLIREQHCPGHAVDYKTLFEVCCDPSMITRINHRLAIREAVREVVKPNYDRIENRIISGFMKFLERQISDLMNRLNNEIDVRYKRRKYRDRSKSCDTPTWWESEDLPRIKQLNQHKKRVIRLQSRIAELSKNPILPPSNYFLRTLSSTPLFRSNQHYRKAFTIMRHHLQAYQVNLDEYHLLMYAKSLPQLYEWWSVLTILRILQKHLYFSSNTQGLQKTPFNVIAEQRRRFVIEFSSDQYIDFCDTQEHVVRLRYEPLYTNQPSSKSGYGILGLASQRTPDIAIEIFQDENKYAPPKSIIVLDAKYSTCSHEKKLQEVREKYSKIGRFDTGELLSHQVWAIMPMSPTFVANQEPEWATLCTVDNSAFWSEHFNMGNPVCGAIQAQPSSDDGISSLELLLVFLLDRLGVKRK